MYFSKLEDKFALYLLSFAQRPIGIHQRTSKFQNQGYVVINESSFFSQYHGPKLELYGRYIDDCIGTTSSTREEVT